MSDKEYERWDKLEIFWEDSYQTHGWVMLDESGYEFDDSLGHQTIGYYIGETPKQVTVCQSRKSHKELAKSESTNVNAVFSIPKSAILKIRKLP